MGEKGGKKKRGGNKKEGGEREGGMGRKWENRKEERIGRGGKEGGPKRRKSL